MEENQGQEGERGVQIGEEERAGGEEALGRALYLVRKGWRGIPRERFLRGARQCDGRILSTLCLGAPWPLCCFSFCSLSEGFCPTFLSFFLSIIFFVSVFLNNSNLFRNFPETETEFLLRFTEFNNNFQSKFGIFIFLFFSARFSKANVFLFFFLEFIRFSFKGILEYAIRIEKYDIFLCFFV